MPSAAIGDDRPEYLTPVEEAGVTRRYGVPGRRYPDFAILRGRADPEIHALAIDRTGWAEPVEHRRAPRCWREDQP